MSVTKAGIVIKITKKKTEFNASQAKKKDLISLIIDEITVSRLTL